MKPICGARKKNKLDEWNRVSSEDKLEIREDISIKEPFQGEYFQNLLLATQWFLKNRGSWWLIIWDISFYYK